MPRVSDDHRAARREQIADAAARCFAHNGFHATSMQQVIAEAGLSAGAVYRYFPSKEALVRHIATDTIGRVSAVLDTVTDADPLPPLEEIFHRLLTGAEPYVESRLRIAVQTWGEALRNPELAALVRELYLTFLARMTGIARRLREAGQLPADSDDTATGRVLLGLTQGYILQRLVLGNADRDQYVAGIRALAGSTPDPQISRGAAGGSR
ncbi:MAG: TetR/AcrR family transcriptional regulator [Micromonosporaceae bacterium]